MKRTLVLGAVWIASAAAAVGLGLLAVSLVDASAAPGTRGVAATATTPPGGTATPAPSGGSATGEQATEAGTVFANCAGGVPVLAGAPAAGWWIDDSDDPGQVEFENGTQKLEVDVICGPGGPQFSVEGPRSDGSDDGVGGTPAPTSPQDDGDDSSGRDGGGHGSDDSGSGNSGSGSDDSGNGGHGSDD